MTQNLVFKRIWETYERLRTGSFVSSSDSSCGGGLVAAVLAAVLGVTEGNSFGGGEEEVVLEDTKLWVIGSKLGCLICLSN